MDYSLLDSPVCGISQARVLEQVAISSSRSLLEPGFKPESSALQAGSLPSEPPGKTTGWHESEVKVSQLRLTLCNPVDYTVHGILQARILEWAAFLFSRGSSQPRD